MTDAELVERLKANDEAAYREALTRYGDALYRYAYRIVADHHLSEDIVAETYLRMVERIGDYSYSGVPLKAWLFRIAHNIALNTLRQGGRVRSLGEAEAELPNSDDPARTVISNLEAADLHQALAALTEDQQQVLQLRFMADQNIQEVSYVLAKSVTAVKQLQLRALRSLGRLLTKQ